MASSEFTVRIHDEGGGTLWAEVVELPGCFAAGDTRDELLDAVAEAIALHTGHAVAGVEWLGEEIAEQRVLIASA